MTTTWLLPAEISPIPLESSPMAKELAMKEITTVDSGLIPAIVGIIVALGGFIRWLIGWQESRITTREKKLEAWEAKLQERDLEYHRMIEKRLVLTERKVAVMGKALFAVVADVQLIDGSAPALTRVKNILHEAYPAEDDIPDEIAILLHRLGT